MNYKAINISKGPLHNSKPRRNRRRLRVAVVIRKDHIARLLSNNKHCTPTSISFVSWLERRKGDEPVNIGFAETIRGKTLASTMRALSIPMIRSSGSTTARGSLRAPILQVPACEEQSASVRGGRRGGKEEGLEGEGRGRTGW